MKGVYVKSIFLSLCLSHFWGYGQDTISKMERIDSSVIRSTIEKSIFGNNFLTTPEINQKHVTVLGENDIIQSVAFRPGVATGIEGSTGFFVRGSGSGGNKIELSGVPIYRASHLLGLMSGFSPEMISSMSFISGSMSATTGDVLSSLMEVKPKTEIADHFAGSISLSPYIDDLYAEIPAGNVFTVRTSLRYSPAFIFADKIISREGENGSGFKINNIGGKAFDIMSTAVWKPSKYFAVDFLFFHTQDGFHYSYHTGKQQLSSKESAVKIGLDWTFREYGSLQFKIYSSSSKALHKEDIFELRNNGHGIVGRLLDVNNKINEKGVQLLYTTDILNFSKVRIGADITSKKLLMTSKIHSEVAKKGSGLNKNSIYKILACFADIYLYPTKNITLRASVRPTKYKNRNLKDNGFDYHFIADVTPINAIGFEVCFDSNSQFFHVLEGLPSGWSQDLMIASDESFPKEGLKQLYAGMHGVFHLYNDTQLNYSIGSFSRKMDGLLSFTKVSHVFGLHDDIDVENLVVGSGKSVGLELYVAVVQKDFNIEISYTYSKATRLFEQLNNGREFNFRYDKPHLLNINGSYVFAARKNDRVKHKHRFNASLSFSSGNLMTASKGRYNAFLPGIPIIDNELSLGVEEMNQLNNFRLPSSFRIDIGYTFSRIGEKYSSDLTISVFNLLNHHNPYQYFYDEGKWKQLSIIPILPSIGFTWHF